MTRKSRCILVLVLVVFFVVSVPLALLYARGYTFDWQKKRIVATGGIYLKSMPKKAEVTVDGKKLKNKTPYLIKRLVPKDYRIEVLKEGFHNWQKNLSVKSHLVAEAKNILLIPKDLSLEIINEELTEDFSLEDFLLTETDQEKLAVAEKNLNLEETAGYSIVDNIVFYIQKPSYILYKTDLAGLVKEQLTLTSLPDGEDQTYSIFASPHQRYLAVLSNQNKLYLFNQEKKSFECLAENIKGVQFADDNKKLLYFSDSEIWVAYFEDTLFQPYKKAGEKELIARLSQPIKKAIWYDETDEHIIFSLGNLVKMTELDGRYPRNTVDLLKGTVPGQAGDSPLVYSQIAYHQDDGKLYLVGNGKLLSVEISD